MICLSDNDLLKKLAICDLLEEALRALDTTRDCVFILPTARYSLLKPNRPDKAKAQLGEVVYERLKAFIERVQVVQDAPSSEDQLAMDDVVGIDSGEAILFSSSRSFESFILATGDKKSLRAVVGASRCQSIVSNLNGRVICFEQLLLRIIKQAGFSHVRAKVVPVSHCDTALRVAFGSGLDATLENVQAALESYVNDLRHDVGPLLIER